MKGKEAYDKIFDKLTYDQQQELGDQVLRTVYQDLNRLEKLEKAIEMLKTKLDIEIYEIHENGVTEYYLECSSGEVIDKQEEYKLLKEVLENE